MVVRALRLEMVVDDDGGDSLGVITLEEESTRQPTFFGSASIPQLALALASSAPSSSCLTA